VKILIDHQLPFMLAHGGLQIQIERTKEALKAAGIHVEYLRWWDNSQKGDIIHFFGRASPAHIDFAHAKGMKYVMSELLTGQGSRSPTQLKIQGMVERALRKLVPPTFLANFRWDAYHKADALILGTYWEAEVATLLFSPLKKHIHVVPNGVEEIFFYDPSNPLPRGNELVCTATITPRKRVVELAEAAIAAKTPLRIFGAPYGEDDPYYKLFLRTVAKAPHLVFYAGPVTDRAQLAHIYQTARGFVLLSTMESRSLSAEEAAASGCPLLLSDLPWARSVFGDDAAYCPVTGITKTAWALRVFSEQADALRKPKRPCRWGDVANQLHGIYRSL